MPDLSALKMSQMFFYLDSKPIYSLNFLAFANTFGVIQPASVGHDIIIVTVYLDGQRYGQVVAKDSQMMKQPSIVVPEHFYKQLPSAKSVVITYIVAADEKTISKFVAELNKEEIQKMIDFYQAIQAKEGKKNDGQQ